MAAKPQPDVVPQRILFISNDDTPAFRQSWLKPLAPLIGEGRITCEIVTGAEVNGLFPPQNDLAALCNRADSWFRERMNSFNPEVIVCCNYSGPSAGVIAAHAKDTGVTLVCHFDDDMLLASPEAASKDKASTDRQDRHNSIIKLLSEAALISCTQARLKSRLRQLGIRSPMAGGRIHVAGEIVRPAEQRAMTRIGIVGGAKFLQAILPQLVRFMRRNTEVSFELLSSDAIPGELKEFGARVELVAAPAEDGALAGFIAKRQWDAGLCPPQDTALTNANWIAHSCAGTATVAVAGTAHDEFCGDGRGMLVGENGWVEGLEYLMDNPRARHAMVERAQRHVEEYFTPELHQAQILSILGEAMALTANTADERWPHEQAGSLAVASLPAAKRIGLQ